MAEGRLAGNPREAMEMRDLRRGCWQPLSALKPQLLLPSALPSQPGQLACGAHLGLPAVPPTALQITNLLLIMAPARHCASP